MESDSSIWMKLLYALPLLLMVIWLLPRARHMFSNSPKAQTGDWRAALLPIVAVILFVLLLIASVRG